MNAPVTTLRPQQDLLSAAPDAEPGWAAGMRLAFLHIPKTAGTAFGEALAQRFAMDDIAGTDRMLLPSGFSDPVLGDVARRHRAFGIGSHLDHDALDAIEDALHDGERLFRVTILREPRLRLISLYRHWQRSAESGLTAMEEGPREAFLSSRHLPLGAFLASGHPFIRKHFRNMQARMICGFGRAEFLDDAALLQAAWARMAEIDVVGTTDAVDDALARIAEAFGWSPPDAVRPLNIAPGALPDGFDAETEALIEDHTRLDRLLWEAARERQGAAPRKATGRRQATPAAMLLDGGVRRFNMAEALDGQGWHRREGEGATLCRWTGPGRRATLRLRAPATRRVEVKLNLVSVLDWAMVEGAALTLDGVPPSAPPRVEHALGLPLLCAMFDLPDAGGDLRELAIEVPFTRSHHDLDPMIRDRRQKGLAIGDIEIAAEARGKPAALGELFWPGEPWSSAPLEGLVALVPPHPHEAEPPVADRNMTIDLPLLRGLLDLLAPDDVWAAQPGGFLDALERGPVPGMGPTERSLVVLATLFEMPGRGCAIATLSAWRDRAVLLLSCAEDFRLRALVSSPLLAPYLHLIGCTNAILAVNLAALRRAEGAGALEDFLGLLERIAATVPEKVALLRPELGAGYALRQLQAVLRGLEAAGAGRAGMRDLLATLILEPDAPQPAEALQRQGRALLAAQDTPMTLADPMLARRLCLLLDEMVAAPEEELRWRAALAAQECAFRLASLLVGWQHSGLAANETGRLALRLRAEALSPPLYPKPAKPFGEYLDFYKAEAAAMAAQAIAPGTVTRLETLRGGLDHVTRLNQAAREIELALRLLGDRFPGEEILWVDAGCSYGVIMNAVEPPASISGRCRFLGFDFNAPGIALAREVAGNLGRDFCRFEVGDVAEAKALAGGRRIHLITAFEVLEHCPDPLAVLAGYRAMEPGMLVVGSPLSEPQGIFPAEQHVWAFDAEGFAALAREAGFAILGVNQRHVGRFVGGHDWVTVTATTADPASAGLV
jgi:hypothetical protein